MEPLTKPEARVLGALIEKQLSTPEYYPLTKNSLLAACNQKSNRTPVVHYGEEIVDAALAGLRRRDIARELHDSTARVPKYGHRANVLLDLDTPRAAIMAELLLRGAQTSGELRSRTSRMHGFESLEQVEAALAALAGRETPLAVQLPRRPGEREARWAHLLCGEPEDAAPTAGGADAEPGRGGRIEALEQEVAALREELATLRGEFEALRRQFE